MTNPYIRSTEILEVTDKTLTVKIEFDIGMLVRDFLGYANNIAEIILDMGKRIEKNRRMVASQVDNP